MFEEAPIVDKQRVYRKATWWAEWLRGVLIGTGLGMALAIGGMHLISGTTSVPAAKSPNQTQQDQSQAAGMSVTVAPVETTRPHP